MNEVVIAIFSCAFCVAVGFLFGHRHGHRCEVRQGERRMRLMHEAMSRAYERELSQTYRGGVPKWN